MAKQFQEQQIQKQKQKKTTSKILLSKKSLKEIANIQINNKEFDNLVKEDLDKGINYPTALSNSIKTLLGYTVSESGTSMTGFEVRQEGIPKANTNPSETILRIKAQVENINTF